MNWSDHLDNQLISYKHQTIAILDYENESLATGGEINLMFRNNFYFREAGFFFVIMRHIFMRK